MSGIAAVIRLVILSVIGAPRRPWQNLALAIVLGPVIGVLGYGAYSFLGPVRPEFTLNEYVFIGSTVVLFAVVLGGVFGALIVAPIMWCLIQLRYAGPLTAICVASVPFFLFQLYHPSFATIHIATVAIFIWLAYLA